MFQNVNKDYRFDILIVYIAANENKYKIYYLWESLDYEEILNNASKFEVNFIFLWNSVYLLILNILKQKISVLY